LDLDKELAWINEMALRGYKLVRIVFGMFYSFECCEPRVYVCQATCVINARGRVDKERREQVEELLACDGYDIVKQTVPGQPRYMIYAMRKASAVPREINTSLESQIEEYEARARYMLLTMFLSLACGALGACLGMIANTISAVMDGYLSLGEVFGHYMVVQLAFIAAAVLLLAVFAVPIFTMSIRRCKNKAAALREQQAVFE
jgi:hypothetical protein